MARTKTAQPLAENKDVQELLALMKANRIPGAKDLIAAIGQVTAMEKHLANMGKELATMRAELAEAQRQNHPIKTALQSAVITLQGNMLDLREKLAALKREIVGGCREALTAVRDKGLSALRNITSFLRLRPALESMRGDIEKAIQQDSAAIAKIEAVSVEYHKAGQAVVNIGRIAAGKEAKQEAKSPGTLSKALQAPLRADRRCLMAMGRCVDRAIGAMGRLEQTPRREPVMETLDKMERKAHEAQRDAPERGRSRPAPAHADR